VYTCERNITYPTKTNFLPSIYMPRDYFAHEYVDFGWRPYCFPYAGMLRRARNHAHIANPRGRANAGVRVHVRTSYENVGRRKLRHMPAQNEWHTNYMGAMRRDIRAGASFSSGRMLVASTWYGQRPYDATSGERMLGLRLNARKLTAA
jgi:hypothetical protein